MQCVLKITWAVVNHYYLIRKWGEHAVEFKKNIFTIPSHFPGIHSVEKNQTLRKSELKTK